MYGDLVSVVVPVYNEESFLDDCINSIRIQSYDNLEIIIIDDGSNEICAQHCDIYELKDKRIKVIHKLNEGLSSARITGYNKASGKWIMFVDDDDIVPLYAVESLISCIKENVDIVAGKRKDMKIINNCWDISAKNFECDIYSGVEVCEKLGEDNQNRIITPLWGKIYRKSFLDSIDLFEYKEICPTIYFEDVLMTPILYSKAKYISLVDTIVYVHREVKTSISRSGKLSSFYFEQIESGNILLEYCKKKQLKNLYEYELKIYFGTIMRLWCLLDKQNLDDKTINKYKISITKYYRKYIKDYILCSNDIFIRKITFLLFQISKDLWGKLVYVLYLKK